MQVQTKIWWKKRQQDSNKKTFGNNHVPNMCAIQNQSLQNVFYTRRTFLFHFCTKPLANFHLFISASFTYIYTPSPKTYPTLCVIVVNICKPWYHTSARLEFPRFILLFNSVLVIKNLSCQTQLLPTYKTKAPQRSKNQNFSPAVLAIYSTMQVFEFVNVLY